jgi:leucyl aminopeptidase
MKTILSLVNPAELETECLAVVVLDRSEGEINGKDQKTKSDIAVDSPHAALRDAVADLIATGEISGKMLETALLHNPAKLKSKRLLLVSGGKAKKFSTLELRRLAGAAVRAMKPKGIRSFAFLAPAGIPAEDAVKAIAEGAFVGNFDPDTY